MRKAPEINNGNSMGMMLTLAIAMANGSSGSRCKQKRVLRNANASLTAHSPQSTIP